MLSLAVRSVDVTPTRSVAPLMPKSSPLQQQARCIAVGSVQTMAHTSGRLALAMRSLSARAAAGRTPCLASRMAPANAVLMRGLAANLAGKPARQVGQLLLPLATHREKQLKQKLCWHGACAGRPCRCHAKETVLPRDQRQTSLDQSNKQIHGVKLSNIYRGQAHMHASYAKP